MADSKVVWGDRVAGDADAPPEEEEGEADQAHVVALAMAARTPCSLATQRLPFVSSLTYHGPGVYSGSGAGFIVQLSSRMGYGYFLLWVGGFNA